MRVLFVCTGNICRSPTAEGVFRKLVADAGLAHAIETASAGTQGYHAGEPPDSRSQAAAKRRGYDLAKQRARRVTLDDFERYDLLVAMDDGHYEALHRMAPEGTRHKVKMMLAYARRTSLREVPDPYYGGPDGFEEVLDLLEDAAAGLLESLGAAAVG